MISFKSHSAAKQAVEVLSGTNQVHFTNEGFEILFTTEKTKEEVEIIADTLRITFSNVKIKGRKTLSILINKINEHKENFRITSVEY